MIRGLTVVILTLLTRTTIGVADASYKNSNFATDQPRSAIVHLFEWKWDDIADECENFLGPNGFGGVQVSPPNKNLAIYASERPWWERYQSVSYDLVTRSGDEEQFANMVKRCNEANVRIYVDAVINHMTGTWSDDNNIGTGGNIVIFTNTSYPGVPYNASHFHQPYCSIDSADYTTNASKVRNCELSGLKDLNQTEEYVRTKIVEYLNKVIGYGVAGMRVDAAKHMSPSDLSVIYDRLDDLNTDHGFPAHARPYIYQEVIDLGGEAISRDEYTPLAAVTEFKVGMELSKSFQGNNPLKWFVNWGPEWALLDSEDAFTFIDNHDNQRGHGSGGNILTFKNPRPYRAAITFLLAHPYGNPQVMSSYNYTSTDAGPPADSDYNTLSPTFDDNGLCNNGWICEHRWPQISHMVSFRNIAVGLNVSSWWDNGNNQIAFCRGNSTFIAFNIESEDLNEQLQTCLPAGDYCDVISGCAIDGACTGKTVTVGADGVANISIASDDDDAVLAIHIGKQSKLRHKKLKKIIWNIFKGLRSSIGS